MKKLIALLCLVAVISLEAKYKSVSNEKEFNRTLDKNELVIAMFYEDTRAMGEQKSDFKEAGRGDKYVTYISVDLRNRNLEDLDDVYSIKTLPTFVLFRNGKMYKQRGQAALLKGEQGPTVIRKFVRTNFSDYVEDIRERKREEARESRASVSFGVGVGYPGYGYYGGPYYGYPYYGYGYPYYGGSGFSVGIGF